MVDSVLIRGGAGVPIKVSAVGIDAAGAAFDETLFNGNIRALRKILLGQATIADGDFVEDINYGFSPGAPLLGLALRDELDGYFSQPWLQGRYIGSWIYDGWYMATNANQLKLGKSTSAGNWTFHYAVFDQRVYD